MSDLGHGVYEHDGEPVNGRVGPAAPRDKLTCPACGLHDQAERSSHPDYAFLCGSCWTLFNATDLEWRRLRLQREEAIKRRENPAPALPPMRSHKTSEAVPVQQRLKEHQPE